MFSVRQSIKKRTWGNCVQLKNPTSEFVELTYGDKCAIFNTEQADEISDGEIGLTLFMRMFFNVEHGTKINVVEKNDIDRTKRNITINVSVLGTVEPKYQEVQEHFSHISNIFTNIPIVPGLKYAYPSKNLYSFVCTNKNFEYTFIDRVKIVYQTKDEISTKQDNISNVESNYKVHRKLSRDEEIKQYNDDVFSGDFNLDDLEIGGLDEQFKKLFRIAFSSRILAEESVSMDIKSPKGILLYGPPGTGKTLIARTLSKILNAKSFQLINGPELLNKYVGQSAENARSLFKEAEDDMRNEIPGLHVIVFDEFDAIGKRRTNDSNVGSSVNNDIVNQLLSKIEGVEQLNNILIIAMTNMKELLDPALIRSGRIELHIEIGLPDVNGRKKIFEIHTKKLRENGHLEESVNFDELASITTNFTGAEIKSVINKAATYPLSKLIDPKTMKRIGNEKPILSMNDFLMSIAETNPVMGSSNKEIDLITSMDLDLSNPHIEEIYNGIIKSVVDYFEFGNNRSICRNFTVLVSGEPFSGKTKLVAHAIDHFTKYFSHIKFITPERILNENSRIWELFQEGKRSETFLLAIDSIETIFDYSLSGTIPHKTKELLSIINSTIDSSKKVVTILTCSDENMIESLGLDRKVTVHFRI